MFKNNCCRTQNWARLSGSKDFFDLDPMLFRLPPRSLLLLADGHIIHCLVLVFISKSPVLKLQTYFLFRYFDEQVILINKEMNIAC